MFTESKRHHLALASAAVAMSCLFADHAAGAARVDFALGEVKALAPDGRSRPLVKGAEIASGETVDTGGGRAQLRFSDGAQVSLAPQTQFMASFRRWGRYRAPSYSNDLGLRSHS